MNRKVYLTENEFLEQNNEIGNLIPYEKDLSCLATKVNIGGHIAPNRLVCQAMEGCDGTKTGEPDELTIRRYIRLARGGAGIIWFEATACCQEGRANPRQLYLTENNIDAFKSLVDKIREEAIRANGYAPLIFMQDTHSGRYSKPNGVPEPIIAYNNPIFEKDKPIDKSRIITDDELDKVRDNLINSAYLAEKAGFDGVDIKCCHRYLNSELLSAYTRENSRYGGSFENRTRLLREAVEGSIKKCSGDFLISTRINCYDGFSYPYGFGMAQDGTLNVDLTEPKMIMRELKKSGVKIINGTMGNPYVNPHVNRPFAHGPYEDEEHPLLGVARMLNGIKEIQQTIPDVPMIASAFSYLGVASPNVAAAYIKNNDFAFAGFGRMIFANPDFAKQILTEGKIDAKQCCIACSKCTELMRAGSTPGCVIRDGLYTQLYKDIIKK